MIPPEQQEWLDRAIANGNKGGLNVIGAVCELCGKLIPRALQPGNEITCSHFAISREEIMAAHGLLDAYMDPDVVWAGRVSERLSDARMHG